MTISRNTFIEITKNTKPVITDKIEVAEQGINSSQVSLKIIVTGVIIISRNAH